MYIKFIRQFRQIKIAGTFIRMNVGKYVLAVLIRIASSHFGVFQENDQCVHTRFRIRELRSIATITCCDFFVIFNRDDFLFASACLSIECSVFHF